MEIKPVKRIAKSNYPTKEIIQNHPELLRIIPSRWKKNAAVLTMLGFSVLLTACEPKVREYPITLSGDIVAPGEPDNFQWDSYEISRLVAPIFNYGTGSDVTGDPFAFSEEQALEIIKSEARNYAGLILESGMGESFHINGAEVQPDLGTKDGKIAVEFLSGADSDELSLDPTASSETALEFAQDYRDQLSKQELAADVGVFYDPGYADGSSENEIRHEEILRAQVRDFIEWLKGQCMI